MATPSLTLYAEQSFGAGALLVGAVVAGFAIGRLLLDAPSGFIVGRLGTDKAMFAGLAGLVASSIVAGLAPDLPTLFAMRVAEGVASSIYVTGAVTYVLLSGSAAKRGGLMGTYHSILMIGHIIGPIIGAPIATTFGLNAPYFAFAGMISVALIAVAAFQHAGRIRVRMESGSSEIQTNNESSNMVAVYLNAASIATFGFAFLRSGVYNTALPLFAYGQLGLSIVEVGTIFTVASMASLVSAFFASRLTSRFGMRGPITASMLLASMLVAIVPHMQGMVHLLVVFTLVGLASGFFGQSVAWAANIVEEKVRKREQFAASQNDKNGDKMYTVKDASSPLSRHHDGSNNNHLAKGLGFNRMMGDLGLIAGPLACGFLFSLSRGGNAEWTVPFLIVGVVLMSTSIALAGRQGGDFVARRLGPVRIGR